MRRASPLFIAVILLACGRTSLLTDLELPPSAPDASPHGTTPPFAVDGGLHFEGGVHLEDAGSVFDSSWPDGRPIDGSEDAAMTFQLNAQHTGAIDDSSLEGALTRVWDADLGALPSYPLIAQGRVYLTAGSRLFALDASTGAQVWAPIDLGPSALQGAAPAYEAGRIFVLTWDGTMRAFDASTGQPLWSKQFGDQPAFFSAPPTPYRGVLYMSGLGYLYALDEASGETLWRQGVAGEGSSPAVSEDTVYATYACAQSHAFDRATGTQLWYHATACSGGGDEIPALFEGKVFAPHDADEFYASLVLDARTGADLWRLSTFRSPGFHASRAFVVAHDGGILDAINVNTQSTDWTFGVGTQDVVLTSPLVVGGRVYVGTVYPFALVALDEATGAKLWSDDLSAYFWDGEDFGSFMALGAAQGLLVVPTMTHVLGYRADARDR